MAQRTRAALHCFYGAEGARAFVERKVVEGYRRNDRGTRLSHANGHKIVVVNAQDPDWARALRGCEFDDVEGLWNLSFAQRGAVNPLILDLGPTA